MMDFIKQNKLLTGGAVVIILAVLYYFMFVGGGAAPLLSADTPASPDAQNLLVTLANLHTIRLDESIFKDPVFVSLTDFGVTIPPEAVGRRNPFAPISGAAPATQSTMTVPAQ